MYERFALKRKEFHANSDFTWKHPDIFITQDEIDEFLRRGELMKMENLRSIPSFCCTKIKHCVPIS